jgi:alpha-glucosidase
MQWSPARNAGFSATEPWLPVGPDFRSRNVENQRADPASILNLYRGLLALRREHPALVAGSYQPVAAQGDLLLYRREHADDRLLVALNMGGDPTNVRPEKPPLRGRILLSSHADRNGERLDGELDLRGNEGVIIGLS